MGGKSSPPSPPDPYQTAGAQTSANQQNASYVAALNRMNSYTPTGSHTYSNQGNDPQTGAPIYSEQTTLSPEQQALYNSNTSNQLNQSGFAGNALDSARSAYHPMDTNYDAQRQKTQDALYSANTRYLDPQYARQEQGLDAKLAAQGATTGSEAWKNAHDEFSAGKSQAYGAARDNSITGATAQTGQQISQGIALQNQPLNYYNSLMTGAQAQTPSFNSAPPVNSNPADVSGAINNAYQGNINSYNAQTGSQNQTTSTIGSLLAMYMMSDSRLKDDHGVIGTTHSGIPIHSYNYKGSPTPQIGVMAQDVEKTIPDAVAIHPSGYKMVNYGKVH